MKETKHRTRLDRLSRFSWLVLGCLTILSCRTVPLGGRLLLRPQELQVSLTQARVRLAYSPRRGTFRVARLHNSIRMAKLVTAVETGGVAYASTDRSCVNTIAQRGALRLIIRSTVSGGPTWDTCFEIRNHPNEGKPTLDKALRDGYGLTIMCSLVGDEARDTRVRFALVGEALTEKEAFACRLAPPATSTPLQIASGDAASGLNSGFYDPKNDCVVHLCAQRTEIGPREDRRGDKTYPIRLEFAQCAGIDFVERFYETVHGFPYLAQRKRWKPVRPVAGWLDWYLTYGKTTEDELLRQVDWLAENLRDWGLEVIQIDDGWQAHFAERLEGQLGKKPTDWLHTNENFPHGMAWLADRIHEKGFQAGIWLVPYATNDAARIREHPDWFLKDADGAFATAQSDWARQFGYVLDLASPQVQRQYVRPLFKTLSSRWGYDYFKLDATGWTLLGIKDETFGPNNVSGADIVREGLEGVREVVGDKFVLACHAPCTEVVGLVEAARVAGDMRPGWDHGPLHLLRQTMDSFHAHGICWLNDPDCLVIRPSKLTVEQARVYASMFGLTGQHLMLSDPAESLDAERVEILRRILPICPTLPRDLYARKDPPVVWDLKISRPFGAWDVVGVFNFDNQSVERTVRFDALGLEPEGRRVVYDFWNRRCLGAIEREIAVALAPTSCRVFAIHRELDRPQVISTSRHITQGGVDLSAVRWDRKRGEISGRSLVVARDPYELRLWIPSGYRAADAGSSADTTRLDVEQNGRLAVARLETDWSGDVRWWVRFQR